MGAWGKCNFKDLKDFQTRMNRMSKQNVGEFCELAAKELAARLLAKVIKRTPVGAYPAETGKKGGTLRRGWTAKSEREAELTAVLGGGSGAKAFADSLRVYKSGDTYEIEIVNPVTYSSYVEFGHRTRNHTGWVDGRYMLTISEQEIDSKAGAILEAKLKKYLEGLMNP